MRVAWLEVALVAAATVTGGCGSASSVPVGPASVGDDGGGGGGGFGGNACTSPVPAMLASGLHAPKKIAVDATDVYYIDAAGPGALYRVSKNGGTPTMIAAVGSTGTDTFDGDLAVDDTTIYLLQGGRTPNPDTLDAGGVQLIYKSGAAGRFVSAVSGACHTAFPHELAVVGGQLYWRQTDVVNPDAVCSSEVSYDTIVALDPTTFQQTAIAHPGAGSVFTVDRFHVSWCDVDGTHRTTTRAADGAVETLAPLVLDELVTDGDALVGFHMTNVWTVTAPQQFRTLFSGSQKVQGLAVDGAHVYFATFSGVQRMAKDGTASQRVVGGDDSAVVVDATSIYYFNGGALLTACK